jgi:hypothetical protein
MLLLINCILLCVSINSLAHVGIDSDESRLVTMLKEKEKESPGSADASLSLSLGMNIVVYGYLAAQTLLFLDKPGFALIWALYTAYMFKDTIDSTGKLRTVVADTSIVAFESEDSFSYKVIQGLYYLLSVFVLSYPLIPH